jgi:hypothetical protein
LVTVGVTVRCRHLVTGGKQVEFGLAGNSAITASGDVKHHADHGNKGNGDE